MASPYSDTLGSLIDEFRRLPGIGAKAAERMAFHVLTASKEDAMRLAFAIRAVKKDLKNCTRCGNLTEGELCRICTDAARDGQILCAVEMPRDLIAIEKTGAFRGRYHVLMGRVSPLDGVGPEHLRIGELRARCETEGVREVILATNPTLEGDTTARCVREALSGLSVRVTRLARGLPSGTELEFAGRPIVEEALEGRTEMQP